MPDLGVIHGKETVRNICNLLKRLLSSSYFKEIFIINQEVTFKGVFNVIVYLQLTIK